MKGAIGIDIGGTKTAFGAVSPDGRIVAQRTIATQPEDDFEAGFQRITDEVEQLLSDAGWQLDDVSGIGVGCPGPVDYQRGIILSVYTLPGWSNHAFATPLSERFGLPVRLENDANAALLGEAIAGAARGRKSAVMLTLGTGIGGAVLLDGKIHHGAGGAHPELGYIPVLAGRAGMLLRHARLLRNHRCRPGDCRCRRGNRPGWQRSRIRRRRRRGQRQGSRDHRRCQRGDGSGGLEHPAYLSARTDAFRRRYRR